MAVDGSAHRALLDRYELREQVGSGGMGEVWLGWDRRLQRDVAVKRLLPQLSDEPSFRQRFGVEARAAAALDHPNVVAVYDIDEDDGTLFLVMERLPGPSLDRRLVDGPLPEDEVQRLAVDMLSGLRAAHAAHLVHRDIKPGNLIRSAGGRWKIGDFGVAKDLASAAQLTLVGVAVGTPAYLAPEQLEGRPATVATDLWAAAVVLREALTGQRPFDGLDPISVAHAVRHTRLTPVAQLLPDVNPDLTGAIDRALYVDPGYRFATAGQMLAAVEGRPLPTPAPPGAGVGPVPGPGVLVATPPPGRPDGPGAAGAGLVPPAPGAPHRRSRWVPVLWAVTAVGAAILVALLVALLIGAFMVGEDDSPDPSPSPATTVDPGTAPGGASEAPEAPDPTAGPGDVDPSTTGGPLGGDGGAPRTTDDDVGSGLGADSGESTSPVGPGVTGPGG